MELWTASYVYLVDQIWENLYILLYMKVRYMKVAKSFGNQKSDPIYVSWHLALE